MANIVHDGSWEKGSYKVNSDLSSHLIEHIEIKVNWDGRTRLSTN